MRHKTSLKSDRMQKLYNFLACGKVFTTAEIQRATKTGGVSRDISDLRLAVKKLGLHIFCAFSHTNRNNRKIYLYQMVR